MPTKTKPFYTPDEYLAMERIAEAKSEYYKGEIFAFAGASINHNRISSNVISELNFALKNRNCSVLGSDMRVWIDDQQLFTYPDVTVVCDKPQFYDKQKDSLINPVLIIEVLSKSTQEYDKEGKFRLYRSLPSFREYVLIDQYSVYVEQFWKIAKDEWHLKVYDDLNSRMALKTVDEQIALADIYHKVEFEIPK